MSGPTPPVLPEYVIIFKNDKDNSGGLDFGLAGVEVKPDNHVLHKPGEKLSPGETTKLVWDVRGIEGDDATIGRVKYLTPSGGAPGEGMIFGVGIKNDAQGPETKPPYFQTYLQHVGAAPVEWFTPPDPVSNPYDFVVSPPGYAPPIIATITTLPPHSVASKKAISVTISQGLLSVQPKE